MNKFYILLSIIYISVPYALATSVSITIDDFNIRESSMLSAKERNERILKTLDDYKIKAALFVVGKYIKENNEKDLLKQWSDKGHLIGNHTFSHPRYDSHISLNKFIEEILNCEKVLVNYPGFEKIFRFPTLHEGDTPEQRDKLRSWFVKNNYRNGYVTIDTSDWYIDQRLREKLKSNPQFDLKKYRDFYLNHLKKVSKYYDDLSIKVLGHTVKHTLLIHFNLLNALFLSDILKMYKDKNWELIDANKAFSDPIFKSAPKSIPSGQSLIWAVAKESGKYEELLRYPAENDEYEKKEMDRLGL